MIKTPFHGKVDEVEQCSVLYGTLFHLSRGGLVSDKPENQSDGIEPHISPERRVRADAQRNIEALLQAALTVFTSSGVDAPVREIADKAGVGIGTLYRHFPQRADLIAAVFRHEIDACADAAQTLADEYQPFDALAHWMQRFADYMATKRGLAAALHSGNPTFDSLHSYFDQRVRPALQGLLELAIASGEVRSDVDANDIMGAVRGLCMSAEDNRLDHTRRMVALFADGLRFGMKPPEDE
jgi:AcrR family transcriptional regulator